MFHYNAEWPEVILNKGINSLLFNTPLMAHNAMRVLCVILSRKNRPFALSSLFWLAYAYAMCEDISFVSDKTDIQMTLCRLDGRSSVSLLLFILYTYFYV